jgi:hypothetical protein
MVSPSGRSKTLLFLKKKKQKIFAPAGCGAAVAKGRMSESIFASFSSEKEVLS